MRKSTRKAFKLFNIFSFMFMVCFTAFAGDISLEMIDTFLNIVAQHAIEYPVKFENAVEREKIETSLKDVIKALEDSLKKDENDQELLWRLGWAQSMAYNLDIPKSGDKTRGIFEYLLKINPDHPQGNWFYGKFLAGVAGDDVKRQSIPYLEKAVSLGYDQALFTLGFSHYFLHENEKALEYLRQYQKKYPADQNVVNFIKGIEGKEGELERVRDDTGPHPKETR